MFGKGELMSNINFVREEHIKKLIDDSEIVVQTLFNRLTIVTMKLPNGFTLTESSGCIDERTYSEEIGAEICLSRIEDRLWELEGYLKTEEVYRNKFLKESVERSGY